MIQRNNILGYGSLKIYYEIERQLAFDKEIAQTEQRNHRKNHSQAFPLTVICMTPILTCAQTRLPSTLKHCSKSAKASLYFFVSLYKIPR